MALLNKFIKQMRMSLKPWSYLGRVYETFLVFDFFSHSKVITLRYSLLTFKLIIIVTGKPNQWKG